MTLRATIVCGGLVGLLTPACFPGGSVPVPESGSTSSAATGLSGNPDDPASTSMSPSSDETGGSDPSGSAPSTTASDPTRAESSSGSAGEDESTSSGEQACGGHACLPSVPAGWAGPVLLYEGAALAPACPASAGTQRFNLLSGLDAGDAQCECSCSNPSGLFCDTPILGERSNCLMAQLDPLTWALPSGSCQVVSDTTRSAFALSAPALNTTAGSCDPEFSANVPDASFANIVRACEGEATEGDCDGLCAPAPEGEYDRACVYFEGDVACPAGAYDERVVAHDGIDDDRACSTCSCGDPEGSCEGEATLYTGGCSGTVRGSVSAGACAEVAAVPTHARYIVEIDAACTADGGEPEGAATPTNPVTFCCASDSE